MTDIVEILREIVETGLGWEFTYGRKDFQNLEPAESEDDPKTYFFLDPVSRDPIYSTSGTFTGVSDYEGFFMILSKSQMDEVYDNQQETDADDGKYRKYINPKIQLLYGDFGKKLGCVDSVQIIRMKGTDVINMFDTNFDGLLVNFKFKVFE